MFIGHYAPAFVLKRHVPQLPLWLLFLAVQWLDVLFFVFVLTGVEHMRLTPGITQSNPLDLYDMPYTHSLLGAVLLALAAAAAAGVTWHRVSVGAAVGLAVVSHFALDWVVHRPDLPLTFAATSVHGLGLWELREVACLLETALFVGGLAYLGWLRERGARLLLGVGLVLIWATPWVPTPPSVTFFAVEGEAMYGMLIALALWTERRISGRR